MDYSFKAKLALDNGDLSDSIEFYKKAAELESVVGEFYFDKPDLEPTRSILIRSAAYLNLKAGEIETAQKFIFFGLLNTPDVDIKQQLNDALEILVSLKNMNPALLQKEYNYLSILRQNSIHYTLEPTTFEFGHSVTLGMINDFTENYLKSLKAYAFSKMKRIMQIKENVENGIQKEIEKIINPIVTNSSYGSFKFSIANDFIKRDNESKQITSFKVNIINKFHNEIFTNSLDDNQIEVIKDEFSAEEINDIFRPLTKIKSNNSNFKIGYYNTDTFTKRYVPKIVNKQRKQLLTTKSISPADIGELINTITHKRVSESGRISKKTISIEEFKKYERDLKLKEIVPSDAPAIFLSEEILVNMIFDSNRGFTFSFDDFDISYTNSDYEKAFSGFNNCFYNKIISLRKKKLLSPQNESELKLISNLIGNIDELK
jgi:hypothetical protein